MELTKEAQAVLDAVKAGHHPNDLEGELEEYVEKWSCSDGFEYGLWDGGYIKPKDILVGDDLAKVEEAMKVLGKFKDLWEEISIEF